MLSVVLCTHNPRRTYLRRCLDALERQSLSRERWELIIVDNRSEEPVRGWTDLTWHPAVTMVREEKLGLTPARLRGIRESKGDLLVFVDDDNVLDDDFLQIATGVAEKQTFLGAWSGQCLPRFEEPPPEWSRRYWGNLVIREFDKDVWSNLPRLPETMPVGAGLCVRREVALWYLHLHESGKRTFQLDRSGASLLSGGDNDLAGCACDIGLGVGLIARLKLTHLMPPERLRVDYLSQLAEGIYFSAVVLDYLRSSSELDHYRVRWHERLRLLLARGPHRRIQLAGLRGRQRGLEFVASDLSQSVAARSDALA